MPIEVSVWGWRSNSHRRDKRLQIDEPIVDTISLVGNRAVPRGVVVRVGQLVVELVDSSCRVQRDIEVLAVDR